MIALFDINFWQHKKLSIFSYTWYGCRIDSTFVRFYRHIGIPTQILGGMAKAIVLGDEVKLKDAARKNFARKSKNYDNTTGNMNS